jgi:hypothetical protein
LIPNLPQRYLERVEEIDAIKAKLLGTDGAAVGLVGARRGTAVQGMGGVGKTVLAAAVVEDPEIRARFRDGIVWLTLGQTPDVLHLQRRLLAWVAPDEEPPTEISAGRDALDTALKSRRWLIVLDDVWRHGDLRAFEVADTPSRLLITTRDEGVVRASGAVPHVIEELTEPAARAFLAAAVGLPQPDLPSAANDVIKECGRLPLALALAGATLADAPKDDALWRDVVAALQAADHEQLQAEFDYPYPHPIAAIQASVDFLPPEDRAAYLQLAIFPEDAPIPLEPLEKLWGIASRCATASGSSSIARWRGASTTTASSCTICNVTSSASDAPVAPPSMRRCSEATDPMPARPGSTSPKTATSSTGFPTTSWAPGAATSAATCCSISPGSAASSPRAMSTP